MPLPYENINLDNVFVPSDKPRRTKVVCTIGPATDSVDKIVELIDAGLNVARLNFSHGDHESKHKTIQNVKNACAKRPGKFVSLLLDTKGPEIRTGFLENPAGVQMNKGDIVEIVTDYKFKGNNKKFACSYPKLPQSVKVGDTILAADGSLVMKVVEILEKSVKVEMISNGKLGERKNMNLPGNKVELPTITPKDLEDIREFGKHVDFIAVSFVQMGSDIDLVREALGEEGKHVKAIAKIENQEGLTNFDDILETFDGIMVARGDMGMEIPIQKVFLAQKMIIRKCNIAGKPVITATQMLESMVSNPRPTRAECTDVANAVLDGTDGVMLSGETAAGGYPIEAVQTMSAICTEAEGIINHDNLFSALLNSLKIEKSFKGSGSDAGSNFAVSPTIASSVVKTQIESEAKVIVVASDNHESAKIVAKYRPGAVVLFLTSEEVIARQISGIWSSVYPLLVPEGMEVHEKVSNALEFARSQGWINEGEPAVCLKKVKGKRGNFRYTMEVAELE